MKRNNSIRVGVDVDGVLANLTKEWLSRYNRDFNDNLKPEDITSWDIASFVKPEAKDKILDYLKEVDLYDNIEVIDSESIDILRKWSEHSDIELFIITACGNNGNMVNSKMNWLAKHYPFLQEDNIVFVNNKGICNVDFMIDDYHKNLDAISSQKGNDNFYPILVDAPHNQHVNNKYIRVCDWYTINGYLQGYINYNSAKKWEDEYV